MDEFHGRHDDPPLSAPLARSGDPSVRDVASRYDVVDGDGPFHDALGEALHGGIGGGVPRDIHGVALVGDAGGVGALQNGLRYRRDV